MNVLHIVTEGDTVGGASIVVLNLSRALKDDGHGVAVASGPPGQFVSLLRDAGVPWYEIPSMKREIDVPADLHAVEEAREVIETARPDVVVCHSSVAGVVGRVAARMERVPSVFTVHGWAFTEGVREPWRMMYLEIERAMAHLTTRFVCVSDYDRTLALDHGFPASKIVTVHNGIPDTGVRRNPTSVVGSLDVVMVARFSEPKDQAAVVRAVTRLPGVRAHFVGGGPTMSAVQALADEVGVADRCIFHGYKREVDPIVSSCDVFCLMSAYEGFPLTTVEAMRLCLPVIVSDVGGAGEAVEEGISGFVIPGGDVDELVRRLKTLRDSPELRANMGRAARQRFEDRFTLDHMYADTLAVYRSAAREAPAGVSAGWPRHRQSRRDRPLRVAG